MLSRQESDRCGERSVAIHFVSRAYEIFASTSDDGLDVVREILAMKMLRLAQVLIALIAATACGAEGAVAGAASPSPSPAPATRTLAPTKPPFTQRPLPAPTRVRWGVDPSGIAGRAHFIELYFDGSASGFTVIDATGAPVLRFPIAGSGIFGLETCMVTTREGGKRENATWISVDDATLDAFARNANGYRVEAEGIGVPNVVLPLEFSGCRR
jgi:hypothetical protein